MGLIRRIVLALALVSAFICLSIFSASEYRADNVSLSSTEDKLPLVKIMLNDLGSLLRLADRIPAVSFKPGAQINAAYDTDSVQNAYNKITNIKENSSSTPLDLASTSLRVVSDANIWQRLKEGLLKDWSRP